MKRTLLILLIITLITIPTLTSITATKEQGGKTFLLASAIEYALAHHPAILSAKSNIAKNEVMVDEAKSACARADRIAPAVYEGANSFTVKEGFGIKKTEAALMLSQKGLQSTEASIRVLVENNFYTAICKKQEAQNAKGTLDLAQQKLADIKEKQAVGLASDLDLLVMEQMLKKSEFDYNKSLRDLDSAMFLFKAALNLDSNTEIELIGELFAPELPSITEEEAIAAAKEFRLEAITAKTNYDLSIENSRLVALWTMEHTYLYKEVKYSQDVANQENVKAQNEVELSVRDAYNNVWNTYEACSVLDTAIALTQKKQEIAQKRFDLGLGTSVEVSDTLLALAEQKTNRLEASLSYILALRQFEYSYQVGVSII